MEPGISDDTSTPSKARVAPAAEPRAAGRSWLGAAYPFVGLALLIALTYNLLQPEIAARLRTRKLANIAKKRPDVIAAGNIGCITQLSGAGLPVVHTVALLDWMAGGPVPEGVPCGD